MSDPTPTSPPSPSNADTSRRRFFWRAAIAAIIAGLAAVIGTRAFAHGDGSCPWQRGGVMGATLDPATVDTHLDRALKHLYVEIDATDVQKQQLAPIVKGAARRLLPIRTTMHDPPRPAIHLVARPTIA